jgi:GDP-L-fucose synthase
MPNVVLFGASGMLGKSIVRNFNKDILCPTSGEVDVLNYESVESYLKSHKPDCVINVTALVAGILANQAQPYTFYYKNQLLSSNILMACLKNETPYLLSCSSTCAYPDVSLNYPMTEDQLFGHLPSIDNLGYGIAKRNIILATQLANAEFKCNYGVIVPSNLYGPYDRHYGTQSAHYVTSLIYKLLNNNDSTITIGGSGKPMRQFTYVDDVARAIKLMVENKDGDVLNCATPENMTIMDIAKKTISSNDLKFEIKLDSKFPDGQYRKDVSSVKLISKYDFEFTDFRHGIKDTYEWYKHNLTSKEHNLK